MGEVVCSSLHVGMMPRLITQSPFATAFEFELQFNPESQLR